MKCPFCNKNKFNKPFKIKSKITNNTVKYFKCSYCKSIFQHPCPDEKILKKYYESYFEIKDKLNPGYLKNENLISFFKERDMTLKEIGFDLKRIINKKNVEVGCANGHFLMYLKNKNADDITGIDISDTLTKSLKQTGIKIIIGDLSDLKEKSIDNLFMFNILEHIPDIEKTMKLIISRLNQKSKLILEVPLSGFISNLFKEKWRFLMPDEHLNIPSLKGLKILLKKYNLQIRGMTRFGSGFTSGSIIMPVKKILDLLAKRFHFGDRASFLIENNVIIKYQ